MTTQNLKFGDRAWHCIPNNRLRALWVRLPCSEALMATLKLMLGRQGLVLHHEQGAESIVGLVALLTNFGGHVECDDVG